MIKKMLPINGFGMNQIKNLLKKYPAVPISWTICIESHCLRN